MGGSPAVGSFSVGRRSAFICCADRDGSYGETFHETASWLGIREDLTAPQSPWQHSYVERLIGSIRRSAAHSEILPRLLRNLPTHLSLNKDAPIGRAVEPPTLGRVIEIPQVGGLHHHLRTESRLNEPQVPGISRWPCLIPSERFTLSISVRLPPLELIVATCQ